MKAPTLDFEVKAQEEPKLWQDKGVRRERSVLSNSYPRALGRRIEGARGRVIRG